MAYVGDFHDNVIEFLTETDRATITAHQKKLRNLLRKLARENPEEVQIAFVNHDGTVVAHVPKSYIVVRKPKTYNLTEEERADRSRRMKKVVEDRVEKLRSM